MVDVNICKMVTGNFWCVDCTCGKSGKQRDFTAEIENADSQEEVFCPNNEELKLKKMGIKNVTIATHERIRGKGRTEKDKMERRKKSFHEQVGTQMALDKAERRHFEKKFGKPK